MENCGIRRAIHRCRKFSYLGFPDKSYLRRRVRFEGVAEDLVFAMVVVVHALLGVEVVHPVV